VFFTQINEAVEILGCVPNINYHCTKFLLGLVLSRYPTYDGHGGQCSAPSHLLCANINESTLIDDLEGVKWDGELFHQAISTGSHKFNCASDGMQILNGDIKGRSLWECWIVHSILQRWHGKKTLRISNELGAESSYACSNLDVKFEIVQQMVRNFYLQNIIYYVHSCTNCWFLIIVFIIALLILNETWHIQFSN